MSASGAQEQAALGEWRGHYERGHELLESGKHEAAVQELTAGLKQYSAAEALSAAGGKQGEAALLLARSAAFIGVSKQLRQRPAEASERQALYNLEPTQLAQLGLQDARRAADLLPASPDPCLRQGEALFQLERYTEAEEVLLRGLGHDPTHPTLQRCLSDTQRLLAASPSASAPLRKRKAGADVADDLECVLCMKLYYEPATTPCGHSFCRGCLLQALDHSNRCPVCRTVLHMGREMAVSIALKNVLLKACPDDYEARRLEHEGAGGVGGPASETYQLPLFVMSVLVPGERMTLNIFEPRYRLLVRRCMEGGRRFGMAQVAPRNAAPEASVGGLDAVACEVEILECAPQPDGRYHLEIQGRQRVRLQQTWDQDGYRVARVHSFHDDPPSPRGPPTPAAAAPPPASAAAVSGGADTGPGSTEGEGAAGGEGAGGEGEGEGMEEVGREVEALAAALLERIRGMMARRLPGAGLSQLQRLLDGLGEKPPLQTDPEAFSFWVAALLQRTLQVEVSPLLAMTSTRERLALERRVLQTAHASSTPCCIM